MTPDDRGSTETRGFGAPWSRKFIHGRCNCLRRGGDGCHRVGDPGCCEHPEPPEGSVGYPGLHLNETAPGGCPTRAPSGTMRAGGEVHPMMQASLRRRRGSGRSHPVCLPLPGASYSQGNRDSVDPPVFDCSSMVGRAIGPPER